MWRVPEKSAIPIPIKMKSPKIRPANATKLRQICRFKPNPHYITNTIRSQSPAPTIPTKPQDILYISRTPPQTTNTMLKSLSLTNFPIKLILWLYGRGVWGGAIYYKYNINRLQQCQEPGNVNLIRCQVSSVSIPTVTAFLKLV